MPDGSLDDTDEAVLSGVAEEATDVTLEEADEDGAEDETEMTDDEVKPGADELGSRALDEETANDTELELRAAAELLTEVGTFKDAESPAAEDVSGTDVLTADEPVEDVADKLALAALDGTTVGELAPVESAAEELMLMDEDDIADEEEIRDDTEAVAALEDEGSDDGTGSDDTDGVELAACAASLEAEDETGSELIAVSDERVGCEVDDVKAGADSDDGATGEIGAIELADEGTAATEECDRGLSGKDTEVECNDAWGMDTEGVEKVASVVLSGLLTTLPG